MMRDYAANPKEERREQEIRQAEADHQDHDDHQMIKIIDQKVNHNHHRGSSSSSANTVINNNNGTTNTNTNTIVAAGKDTRNKLIFFGDDQGNNSNNRTSSIFEMSDLLKASAEGLGHGSFGNCYKAMMEGKAAVVVKRLRNLKPLTAEEFEKQLRLIAEQKHPNLLPLLAYYDANDEKLLVCKYVETGNLFDRIHGNKINCVISLYTSR